MTDVRWWPLLTGLGSLAMLWWFAGWGVALGVWAAVWAHNLEFHAEDSDGS